MSELASQNESSQLRASTYNEMENTFTIEKLVRVFPRESDALGDFAQKLDDLCNMVIILTVT
jgi:hypothetical protein